MIAGGSASIGALAGGAVVYQTLRQPSADPPGPVEELLPSADPQPGQTLTFHSTEVETAITQSVEKVVVRGNHKLQVQVTLGEAQHN